jgi:hypothetical protein
MWKGAAALLVTLAMAACGRSPLEPSSSADHVEPPGVLAAPGAGQRTADHVEPPGVLRGSGCDDAMTAADDHVEPPGVLRGNAHGRSEPAGTPDPDGACTPAARLVLD